MLALEPTTSTYLGPARVIAATPGKAHLRLHDQELWAQVALAFPYQLTPGDTVLVIGQEEAWYVIGVLRGSGKTVFSVPADLELRAPNGNIELNAGRRVVVRGQTVQLAAHRLELLARDALERFTHAARWVQEGFQVRAGRMLTRVREAYRVKAARIHERAEGPVHIDGEKINLG